MRNENDVGAGWRKQSKQGNEYISISLDVDRLLELAGGVTGKLNLVCFVNKSDHPKAPDYQLMYFQPRDAAPQQAERQARDAWPEAGTRRERPAEEPRRERPVPGWDDTPQLPPARREQRSVWDDEPPPQDRAPRELTRPAPRRVQSADEDPF